jgi:hypothetical protein
MNKQLYIKHSNGFVKKISQYRPGPLSDTIEVEQRKRWYSLPWDAEVYEFDPNTLTITTLVPVGPLR